MYILCYTYIHMYIHIHIHVFRYVWIYIYIYKYFNVPDTLNNIPNNFFVTPLVKVKVTCICQRFYALVLTKELGFDQNKTSINKTYIQVNKPNNQVISDHTTFLQHGFNLKLMKKRRNSLTSTGH